MRQLLEELLLVWRLIPERLFPWLRGHVELVLSGLAIVVSVITLVETTRVSESVYVVGFRFDPPRQQGDGSSDLKTVSLRFQAINAGNRPAIIERVFINLQEKNERSCSHPENRTYSIVRGSPSSLGVEGYLPTINLAPSSATEVATEFRDLRLPPGEARAACLILVGYNFHGDTQFASTYVADFTDREAAVVDWPKRMEFLP